MEQNDVFWRVREIEEEGFNYPKEEEEEEEVMEQEMTKDVGKGSSGTEGKGNANKVGAGSSRMGMGQSQDIWTRVLGGNWGHVEEVPLMDEWLAEL